ncbi:MAG: RNA polymerase sigma factor [Elusimicrobia bacterium]|nr:RNA polymerase sigma factor [Elusimicrobiota bacterium]
MRHRPKVLIRVSDEEDALLGRARAGDRNAFGELVLRHRQAVFGLALRLLRDWDSAEEATQIAFVKAFHSLRTFEGRSSFRTWVCSIALNAARESRRRGRLGRWAPMATGEPGEERVWTESLRAAARGPSEVDALERHLELERAMESLSAREREMAVLRLEGYTMHDIAAALHVSEGTVKSTLHDATHKMKKEF